LGPAQFSPLTTYGAADPRKSKMQTLVELPPTASPQVASRTSTASCSFFLGNLRLLVQNRQRYGEGASPHALRGRSLGPDPH
ncbi:MAG: hypothetical protein WCH77_13165, partial [Planctomycetota bacterium]